MIWLIINIILIVGGASGAWYIGANDGPDNSARLFVLAAFAIVCVIGLISGIIQWVVWLNT